MTRAEADAILAILGRRDGEPDRRSWGEQYSELSRVHRKGAPKERAERLQRLYRLPSPSAAEERMISVLEEKLFPLLAAATASSVASLRAELHHGQPAFGAVAPGRAELPLPEAPGRRGWAPLGAFRVFGGLLVAGEGFTSDCDAREQTDGSRANVRVPARDGVWFAYQREKGVERCGLAVHESVSGPLPEARAVGVVWVEGGTVPVLDAEVRDDAAFCRESERSDVVLGRGCVFSLGGDGNTEIRAGFVGGPRAPHRARAGSRPLAGAVLAACLWVGGRAGRR